MTISRSPKTALGFTLIEIMVALVVSAIVVLGVFAFSTIQQTTAGMHQRNVRVQQALEGAMWTMAQDVRTAGLGFTRVCSELRIFAPAPISDVINPGAEQDPNQAFTDIVTGMPPWVLRDGLQAHWQSSGAGTFDGGAGSSAAALSAADSFDVIMGDRNYTGAYGMFTLQSPLAGGLTDLTIKSSNLLDSGDANHLAQMQQLFPVGTFVALARTPAVTDLPFRPENHGQCPVVQITDDVQPGPTATEWLIPIGNTSGFNQDLAALVADQGTPANDDWDPGAADNAINNSVIPLGQLRWSRYEIDYTVPQLPYLVRYDIIGFQQGVDPANLGTGPNYPHCAAGFCPAPQLHLPGSLSPPIAVAIGPMIEDMQVAVGCDGYAAGGGIVPDPEATFEEQTVPPNLIVDELAVPGAEDRPNDEWLGNGVDEQWAPDCVWYGTAEYNQATWLALHGAVPPPPDYRMSPQTFRITLLGSAEELSAAGGIATDQLMAVEDRGVMTSITGGRREHMTLTERFTPRNLRWRDPSI